MEDYTDQQLQVVDQYAQAAQTALLASDVQSALQDVNLYYNAQISFRGYASDAIQVVNDTGLFGLVARAC